LLSEVLSPREEVPPPDAPLAQRDRGARASRPTATNALIGVVPSQGTEDGGKEAKSRVKHEGRS